MPSTWGKRSGGQYGPGYDRFRTGLSYSDVLSMLWSNSEDSKDWKYKRRGTVLGLWHQLKKGMWVEARRREDAEELRPRRRASGGG